MSVVGKIKLKSKAFVPVKNEACAEFGKKKDTVIMIKVKTSPEKVPIKIDGKSEPFFEMNPQISADK